MSVTANVEIIVEVPASMAGAFTHRIKELVGEDGSVELAGTVDAPILSPGETLRVFREDAGYTQAALAGMLQKFGRKTDQVYISKLEKEAKPMSKKMAGDLAKIFGTGYKVFYVG